MMMHRRSNTNYNRLCVKCSSSLGTNRETKKERQMVNANFPLDAEGRTFHLGCKKGEIASRILSVGDASRAELLSQFLRPFPNGDPIFNLVSSRGFSVTTGVAGASDTPVSIVTTLMGLANMDFVIRESTAVIDGPMAVIRLGTCGALQPGTLGKILVPAEGCVLVHRNFDAFQSPDSDMNPYLVTKPVLPHPDLCNNLISELQASLPNGADGIKCGTNCTTDSFYSSQGRTADDFDDRNEGLIEQVMDSIPNAVSFEMETFQLLHLAHCSKGRVAAAACAIGLAERANNQFMTPAQLAEAEEKAGKAAIDALANFDLSLLE
jgi:uridine phosphorylase